MDSFEGFGSDPASLHKYTYCSNNPVNRIDPSGHTDTTELTFASSIAVRLQFGAIWGMLGGTLEGYRSVVHGGNYWDGFSQGFTGGFIGGFILGPAPASVWATPAGQWTIAGFSSLALTSAFNEAWAGHPDLAAIDALIAFSPLLLNPRQLAEYFARYYSQSAAPRRLPQVDLAAGGETAETAELAFGRSNVRVVDPAELRWSQNTAGGNGRADGLRQSMSENGWAGDPIDVVLTQDGLVTVDHTRAAVALELGIKQVPVAVHSYSESLPTDMLNRPWNTKGETATTWGEAVALRGGGQKPPIGPTGSPKPPRLPKPKS